MNHINRSIFAARRPFVIDPAPKLAKLALLTVAVVWGSSLVVVKGATDYMSPLYLLALRFTIGCGTLCLIFRKQLGAVKKDDLKCGGRIGFFLFLAYTTQTLGVMFAMPGKSAFLSSIYCVVVPFLYWFTEHRKPDGYTTAAAVMCIAGISLSTLTSSFSIEFGDSLAILSGFFFASHIVAVSKYSAGKDPVLMTILQFGTCSVLCWIATLLFEGLPQPVDAASMSGVLYLGVACTALALLLQNIGQKYADPSSAAILLSLESVFGILFSVWFCGERLSVLLILGFILIFSAILLSETKLAFVRRH